MRLAPFGAEVTRKTVVILGAGATRGASFVTPWSPNRPPLDADYFRTLRNSDLNGDRRTQRLIEFIGAEFGSIEIGMEDFYSQASLSGEFIQQIPSAKRRHRRFDNRLGDFLSLLPEFFGCSLAGQECVYHEFLVKSLEANDTIISFNYDCLADRSLRRNGGRRWLPDRGYGFSASSGSDNWCHHEGRGRFPRTGIRLLKPHGSLNWRREPGGMTLIRDEYAPRNPDDLEIIPPLWQKRFDESPYEAIWEKTRGALSTARALVVVGYSLPTTDVFTHAALRTDVDSLDVLVVVNPNREARSRLLTAVRSAISGTTRIVELDSFEDLAKGLGYVPPLILGSDTNTPTG